MAASAAVGKARRGALDKMMDDDFIPTPPGGRDTNKKEWLGLVQSGRQQYVAFKDSDIGFRSWEHRRGEQCFQHSHAQWGTGTAGKRKLIWVWVELDGEWKLVGVEGTQVTVPRAVRK